MNVDRRTSIAAIVLAHPACAGVFQDRRIDFCCSGEVSVPQACAARGLDPEAVFLALDAASAGEPKAQDVAPREMDTPALVAFIVERHHAYLRVSLPHLVPLATKVAQVHGDHDPRLRELQAVFADLREAIDIHLEHEEEELFREATAPAPDRDALSRKVPGMLVEHRELGAALQRIRDLADDFAPPRWACTSYRMLLTGLRALEDDLVAHIHLENYVLLPRFASVNLGMVRAVS